ncbi:MAG: hypothetical protein NC251_01380 [Lachnoclostridium sp.]|nr:hypothetical protein [Lachnospira sp.]MCM1247060.1 hypothetical protein [Lachnoclostridium sp.]MCM1534788.1 hypothetical protein [Clostridium sp.]
MRECCDIEVFRMLPADKVDTILQDSPGHLVDIIADILLAFLLKENVPVVEAEELAGKVKEKKMAQLFENMEKMDIQAERRNTAREAERADKAERRAEAAEQREKEWEKKMAQLFENMEKMDIQAERRNTAREAERADKAEQRAEEAERKAEEAEQKAKEAEQRVAELEKQITKLEKHMAQLLAEGEK